jgi:hypothetical protein
MLTLDTHRSFKFNSAKDIIEFQQTYGCGPNALILYVTRDQEFRCLHKNYGVLEELKNGRLNAHFGTSRIWASLRRGTSIIVFTYLSPKYTAPLFKALMSIQYLAQLRLLKVN